MKILVSACLLGVSCRYDGTGEMREEVKELMEHHHLIPVCPEILGGLKTPRCPAGRQGGDKRRGGCNGKLPQGSRRDFKACKALWMFRSHFKGEKPFLRLREDL